MCLSLSLLLEQNGSLQTITLYKETAVSSLEWFVTTHNKKFKENWETPVGTTYVRLST